MKWPCISDLSAAYRVRALSERDLAAVLALCESNPLYYRHCGFAPTAQTVRADMTELPPGKTPDDKHFVGFFEGDRLAAVLDFVGGYPDPATAYVGFFMVDGRLSGRGIGTGLIEEICGSLKGRGFSAVRLAYHPQNPQASHFWRKNGFLPLREAMHERCGRLTVAQRAL